MRHIFISYSRSDEQDITRLLNQLEVAGYKIWRDSQDIRGGDQWRRQIVMAIEDSEAFIIALSPNSIKSENVRKELDIAESAKKRIVPVEIKSVIIPPEMTYQLVGLQRIELMSDSGKLHKTWPNSLL